MSSTGADRLLRFIDSSPTPFHAVATVAEDLDAAGFTRLDERAAWPSDSGVEGGSFYVVRGGSLIAWRSAGDPTAGFRVVGAHTDSPNLRLKQHHDVDPQATGGALGVVALEPYGGPILRSWFDRDLGVAGRLALRDGTDVLVRIDEPVLRIPHLAIHLDRDAKDKDLDPQRHLNAIWSLEPGAGFLPWLAAGSGVEASEVLGFELMAFDLQPSTLCGARREFVSAPRLDNLVGCFSGLEALVRSATWASQPVLALFDHEEVGSTSERGAQSDFLATTLERIVAAAGGGREEYHRSIAGSWCASGDMAHATHPNHREKHEPLHPVFLGGGPVLKVNQNLRYASEARGAALFARACEHAEVPLQRYVHRADLPCGSTIGPLSAARTGIATVDVGAPQLAMHSCREFMSADDVDLYSRALAAFYAVD